MLTDANQWKQGSVTDKGLKGKLRRYFSSRKVAGALDGPGRETGMTVFWENNRNPSPLFIRRAFRLRKKSYQFRASSFEIQRRSNLRPTRSTFAPTTTLFHYRSPSTLDVRHHGTQDTGSRWKNVTRSCLETWETRKYEIVTLHTRKLGDFTVKINTRHFVNDNSGLCVGKKNKK